MYSLSTLVRRAPTRLRASVNKLWPLMEEGTTARSGFIPIGTLLARKGSLAGSKMLQVDTGTKGSSRRLKGARLPHAFTQCLARYNRKRRQDSKFDIQNPNVDIWALQRGFKLNGRKVKIGSYLAWRNHLNQPEFGEVIQLLFLREDADKRELFLFVRCLCIVGVASRLTTVRGVNHNAINGDDDGRRKYISSTRLTHLVKCVPHPDKERREDGLFIVVKAFEL